MGIRDKPTAPAAPWQNGFAERLIGSIRCECLDHIVVFGEAHLRRILRSYAYYYNDIRTHRSLDKDAPVSRRTWSCNPRSTAAAVQEHVIRLSKLVASAVPLISHNRNSSCCCGTGVFINEKLTLSVLTFGGCQ
jgi:hypothetical protein